jgi:hypothetical protein
VKEGSRKIDFEKHQNSMPIEIYAKGGFGPKK